jgi:cysteine desulfurase
VGLGRAAALAGERLPLHNSQVRPLRDRLYEAILSGVSNAVLNGHPEERLPNTLNVSFPGVDSTELQVLVRERLACSTGCGCHAGKTAPSATLLAIGRDAALATAALRLTLGIETTRAEIDEAGSILINAVNQLCRPALQAKGTQ